MRLANSQIAAAEQPIEQQIAAERKANLSRAQQQMGFAKAAAALLQGIAPRVQDTYTNAANADAGYAKGLGDAVQGTINQGNDANNAFLQQMGTPTGGLHTAADVGGTAYGLQGYIPATTLQREGAGFGAAAQMLPGDVLSAGRQSAAASLNDNTNIAQLQSELSKLAATQPEVYQKVLAQLSDMGFKRAELGQSQQRINISRVQGQERINLSRASLASENAYRQASLQFRQADLRLAQQRQALAVQKAIQAGRQPDASLSKIYGYVVDNNGDPILSKGKKIKVVSGTKGKGVGGQAGGLGLTPNEIHEWMGKAGNIARTAWNGSKTTGKMQWHQALSEELLSGVPRPIAIQALRKQGYMPGVRGAPPLAEGGGLGMFHALGVETGKGFKGFKNAAERGVAVKLVSLAHEYMGTPYLWGGESPKGFDCSGFAEYLYAKVGISIPRTSETQWQAGRKVSRRALRPGDLVFFKGSDSVGGLPGHVGIYIGGGKMIDAPHTGSHVRIDDVFSFGGYMGARRYN